MTETEKEEKNKAAYLDLPNFWLTSRPWLMLAFIGAFIFCQLLVFKHFGPGDVLLLRLDCSGGAYSRRLLFLPLQVPLR